jgi:hypothetical protein
MSFLQPAVDHPVFFKRKEQYFKRSDPETLKTMAVRWFCGLGRVDPGGCRRHVIFNPSQSNVIVETLKHL